MKFKTVVVLEVEHDKPIPQLANMIAGRAYTIQGVTNAEPIAAGVEQRRDVGRLERLGFTHGEIALGLGGEVYRS